MRNIFLSSKIVSSVRVLLPFATISQTEIELPQVGWGQSHHSSPSLGIKYRVHLDHTYLGAWFGFCGPCFLKKRLPCWVTVWSLCLFGDTKNTHFQLYFPGIRVFLSLTLPLNHDFGLSGVSELLVLQLPVLILKFIFYNVAMFTFPNHKSTWT